MAEHTMNLKKRFFDGISSGTKTYEARENDDKREKVKKGDIVVFTCGDQSVVTQVVDRHPFPSFVAAVQHFSAEGKLHLLGFVSEQEAIELYHSIRGYAEATDVVVFELTLPASEQK